MAALTRMLMLRRAPLLANASVVEHIADCGARVLATCVACKSSPLIGSSRLVATPGARGALTTSVVHARSFSKSADKSSGDANHLQKLADQIERSREQGDAKKAVKCSLELYDALTTTNPHDPNVLSVACEIARLYDEELDEPATALKYYLEALKVLPDIATLDESWLTSTNITTLGAVAICYDRTEDVETAEEYYEKAILAYNELTNRSMQDKSDSQFFLQLNSTVAMISYHYGGNLATQGHFEDAKDATTSALRLSEDSDMSIEELDRLQWCVHDLWLEMSLAQDGLTKEDLLKEPIEKTPSDKTSASSKKRPGKGKRR